MDEPILFFDSGVGGLSILGWTRAYLPWAPIVYVADNKAFPYGTKDEAEIAARVPALLGRLVERVKPRLVVIACNTASTIALEPVRAALDIPVVGTVPAIKPAAEKTKTGVIGVLGTEATVRQSYVDELTKDFADNCMVIRHGSSTLVELAEKRMIGEKVDRRAVKRAAKKLFDNAGDAPMDYVVLACTHFPLIADWLREAYPDVTFIDSGDGIARRIVELTKEQDWPDMPPPARAIFTAKPPKGLVDTLARVGITEISTL